MEESAQGHIRKEDKSASIPEGASPKESAKGHISNEQKQEQSQNSPQKPANPKGVSTQENEGDFARSVSRSRSLDSSINSGIEF